MVDGESGEVPSSLGRRIAVVVAVTVVAPLFLLMYAFHLLWFSPEITGSPKCDPSEFGVVGGGVCGPEHGTLVALAGGDDGDRGGLVRGAADVVVLI